MTKGGSVPKRIPKSAGKAAGHREGDSTNDR